MKLFNLTVSEALDGLSSKKFSSVELTKSCLQQLRQTEDNLNAFITVTDRDALQKAAQADKRRARGSELPLLGIPVGIKDIFCTRDIQTTAGSSILHGFVPPYDATVVQRLKTAGAVIIGKLNQDAFAHGASGENSDFGPTHNPWDTSRVPGGSSSGSAAAVAAGQCLFSTGTDTGGSIRNPSSFCNLVGLKSTYGRVSRYGVIAMASSLDCPGVMTRSVKDQSLILKIIAGDDPYDATTLKQKVPDYMAELNKNDLSRLKIGIPKEFFVEELDSQVSGLLREAKAQFENLGHQAIEVTLPHAKYGIATYYLICLSEISSNLARYDGIRFPYSNREGNCVGDIYTQTRGLGFGTEAKRRILLGTYSLSAGYYDAYYEKAQKVRTLIKQDFEEVFKQVDVILAPTTPTEAFKLGEKTDDPLEMYLADIFTAPVNLAGIPALNLPCGFIKKLPLGMQLIGPQLSEVTLLKLGHQYQQLTDWHKRRPPTNNNVKRNQTP